MREMTYDYAVERSETLLDAGREAEAVAVMEQLTLFIPRSAEAWYRLGEICFLAGELEKAERALTRAHELLISESAEGGLTEAYVFFSLGSVLLRMEEYRKAAFFLSQVLTPWPCNFAVHHELSQCFLCAGAFEDLLAEENRYLGQDADQLAEEISRWIDSESLSSDAYEHLGRLAYRRGDKERAVACFEKAFYAGVQCELNSSIERYVAGPGLTDSELAGLAQFQESINRRLDHPMPMESDIEIMGREARRFYEEALQLKLDFTAWVPRSRDL